MATKNLEEELHISRYIIIYKFILGLFELFLGLGIILFGKQVLQIYQNFKTQEFLEDPHDLIALITEKGIPFILEHQGYIVFTLILFGGVKIVGAIGLFYQKHWGLDLLVGLTVLLLPFQTYNLVLHPSLSQLAYFAINMLIALYLVQFKPHHYISKVRQRMRR